MLRRFNVRVYGILMNENDQILLSDELIKERYVTKFPGGGVELGEGLRDALIREFKEECGIDIAVLEHFYTTDFFVPSQFDSESQVLSMYYIVACEDWRMIETSGKKFDFPVVRGMDAESKRWVDLSQIDKEADIVLPVDKVVAQILANKFPKVGFRLPSKG